MKDGSEINQLHIFLIAISVVISYPVLREILKVGPIRAREEGNPCHGSITLLNKLAVISNSPHLKLALIYSR